MIVIPAIDLKDGQCVRLFQGDYGQVTVYDADPVAVAQRWQAAGAQWLHLVDLDGARAGTPQNLAAVKAIRRATSVPIEFGGGVRDLATLGEILGLGIERVVLGTAAVEDAALVSTACRKWAERIAVGIDAHNGLVATRGWRETTTIPAPKLAEHMVALGVQTLIYTDIARDGTLTQPNCAEVRRLAASVPAAVIASGGVASVEHLRQLASAGAAGVIVGKALYTGDLDLATAIRAMETVADAH